MIGVRICGAAGDDSGVDSGGAGAGAGASAAAGAAGVPSITGAGVRVAGVAASAGGSGAGDWHAPDSSISAAADNTLKYWIFPASSFMMAREHSRNTAGNNMDVLGWFLLEALAAAALLALVVWLTWPRKSKDNDGDPPQNGNR